MAKVMRSELILETIRSLKIADNVANDNERPLDRALRKNNLIKMARSLLQEPNAKMQERGYSILVRAQQIKLT